jgi:hypothetical protein
MTSFHWFFTFFQNSENFSIIVSFFFQYSDKSFNCANWIFWFLKYKFIVVFTYFEYLSYFIQEFTNEKFYYFWV